MSPPVDEDRVPKPEVRPPTVSVVAAVHNKASSLRDFMTRFADQTYPGQVELVLVDDASTDGSGAIIRHQDFELPGLVTRLVTNPRNLGNCASRNRGIESATGDVLIVLDADCLPNREFVAEHARSHRVLGADITIGPMGIETAGRPIERLFEELSRDPARVARERVSQWPSSPACFLNCVTNNFSVSRSFLTLLDEPLFDPAFSYSKAEDSGFGWEDIEMGYRCWSRGARIRFASRAWTVHRTHPPEIPDADKPLRSLANFERLLGKHSELGVICPSWALETLDRIEAWLSRHGLAAESRLRFLRAGLDGSRHAIELSGQGFPT